MKNASLQVSDPEIAGLITREEKRQDEVLEMIPSENYASKAVREAVGSVLMNKYSEGQVGKRYYQGNAVVDEIEALCKARALAAFHLDSDAWGVNVQALSGSPANLAVYAALLKPGDKILSMYLSDGGHLSHGWQLPDTKVTLPSQIYDIQFYHVDRDTRVFDYKALMDQAKAFQPKLLISGGTAYPREIDHKAMGEIARAVGAYYLADVAHEAGLIAAGVNSSPFSSAHVVTMTTHKTLRGPRGAMIFARKGKRDNESDYYGDEDLSSRIDRSVFPGLQGGPHNHTISGIAVALHEAMQEDFLKYAQQTIKNAQALAQIFLAAGFDVVSGGTDKHLLLLDLRKQGVSAWICAWALEYANIVVNRNTVPFDTGSSVYPSGLRMGTPAITTRGMKEKEMETIGAWIIQVLREISSYTFPEEKEKRKEYLTSVRKDMSANKTLLHIAEEVKQLTKAFPIP